MKVCSSKFRYSLKFSLNLCPKEEKFIQIYLVILKTLIICNLKKNLFCNDSFHTVLSK
jgi:hypothetical protein